MIVQIDSGFRDYQKFPYNSEMTITVNGQPPNETKLNDIRSTSITENFIQNAFQWVGNTQGNNPLSKIPKDTFLTKIIPINSRQCIIIPENESIKKLISTIDYFIGIELWNEDTNLTSNIVLYDKNIFLVTVLDDIFKVYFENILPEDCLHKDLEDYYIDGYFINTSYHEKNNLILLGTTNVNYQPSISTNFVIFTGAYKGLIVENVTKNWKREITNVNGIFRHVILRDIPSYDSSDFFIMYKEPTIIKNETKQNFFKDGIEKFKVLSIEKRSEIRLNEIFKYKDVILQVQEVNELSNQVKFIIIHPGNNIYEQEIKLESLSNSITIRVLSIGSGFIMIENGPSTISSLYILAIIDTSSNSIEYFTIQSLDRNLVYIDYKTEVPLFRECRYLYFIPYRNVFPNIVIPTIPTQNRICVEAQLVSLILPNLPICGYNIRLADIPYVLVTLCNSQGQSCEIQSTLYSNVPAASSHNFMCPIANVKNPRLNFAIVTCKQKAIFKFSPRDTLLFRVSLPNGQILKYINNKYSRFFDCPPLDIPLNLNRKRNEKVIYPYILNNSISAVFEMRFL